MGKAQIGISVAVFSSPDTTSQNKDDLSQLESIKSDKDTTKELSQTEFFASMSRGVICTFEFCTEPAKLKEYFLIDSPNNLMKSLKAV